jgi:hypothetical protein
VPYDVVIWAITAPAARSIATFAAAAGMTGWTVAINRTSTRPAAPRISRLLVVRCPRRILRNVRERRPSDLAPVPVLRRPVPTDLLPAGPLDDPMP